MKMLIALLLTLQASTAFACPIGSFPSVNSWGNQICKTFGEGSTSTIQGGLANCPVGSHPGVDSWGNQVCQSFGGGSYYDTSRGCPTGSYPSVDSWGNQTCKFF